jgi:hypothetical protein
MTDRARIQCQHCSNPDRDGPNSRCRFFWYTDIKARDAFLATPNRGSFTGAGLPPARLFPCEDEREIEGMREDRYQDECWAARREDERKHFWRQLRVSIFVAFCISVAAVLIAHGIGHHWVHR